MIRKLLCWFGFHFPILSPPPVNGTYKIVCFHCGRRAG